MNTLLFNMFTRVTLLFLIVLLSIINLAYAGTVQRPISDWTSAQGSSFYTIINGYTLHRYSGWANADLSLFYLIDSAGDIARDLNLPPPKIDGKVTERDLGNGTAEVTVNIHTTNAITFVTKSSVINNNPQDCTLFGSIMRTNGRYCPTLFGYGIKDIVQASPGALTPARGDSNMQVRFINPIPAGMIAGQEPLPDLINLTFFPIPGEVLEFESISSSAFGELRALYGVPDGTPGRAQAVQTGLFVNPGVLNNHPDGFPVENIDLKIVGNGTQ